jgi:uncharacterized protein (TIGR00369 family)
VPHPEHWAKLENAYHAARCNEYYRPRLRISQGAAEIEVDVEERFFHAANAVHGSVYFKLLDDAAFFAVNSVVEEVFVLTASFQIYLLRPVDSGTLRATGRLLHGSRRLYLAEAELHDADGRPVARGSGTFMRSQIRLTPEIGYK